MKKIFFVLVLSGILAGCAWRGEITPDSYEPVLINTTPTKATIGLLNVPTAPVKYGMSVDYKLDISNYIFALQKELQNHFTTVKVINNLNECPECNLFARPKLIFQIIQSANLYRGAIRVDFLTQDQRLLESITSQTTGDASPDRGTVALTVANSLTMGLLAPASISDYGQLITEVAQTGISELLNDVGYKVQASPFLSQRALTAIQSPEKKRALPVAKEYRDFMPAVVVIATKDGHGSGFIISKKGEIITNAHVVGNWARVTIKHSNGKSTIGQVIKVDKFRDLALIKTDQVFGKPLTLGSESALSIGDKVVAIGSPKGLEQTLTEGVVSQVRNNLGVRQIQTDTDITHGSSGGPLIQKSTGKVIGVNASGINRDESGNPISGLNFAVSVEELKDFLKE